MKDISVIIPVYNEATTIVTCLESLGRQTLKPKEIIVVNDGSTDKTSEVLSKLKVKSQKLTVIKQEHLGAGAARNNGSSSAKWDILVFVDADMRFAPDFLADLTKPIYQGKSKGTFSTEEFIDNWTNVWARLWNYRRRIYEPRAIPADYPNTAPVFRAILKSEFDRVGGFDPTAGYADDWSLSEKLGYQSTATAAAYCHSNPSTLKEAFYQARWAAKRQYKRGIMGAVIRLLMEFPLWAPIAGTASLWQRRERLAESTFVILCIYPIFLFASSIATAVGISEFLFFREVSK